MSDGRKMNVLNLVDGMKFAAGKDSWFIEPLKIDVGSWVALVPEGRPSGVDPSEALTWILATMAEPVMGTVELFGLDIYRLDELDRQRLRFRIGFVHGNGGLISNRTVRENIALPVAVHGNLGAEAEEDLINKIIEDFALERAADQKPHEVDGATRWSVCLARALVLKPQWLILEGLGSWEMDRGTGRGWKYLVRAQQLGNMATAICLPRRNPGFESWFGDLGGIIVPYDRSDRIEE